MEGGSQAQDHGQAIYAKIRYSVSSTFATGCSSEYDASAKKMAQSPFDKGYHVFPTTNFTFRWPFLESSNSFEALFEKGGNQISLSDMSSGLLVAVHCIEYSTFHSVSDIHNFIVVFNDIDETLNGIHKALLVICREDLF